MQAADRSTQALDDAIQGAKIPHLRPLDALLDCGIVLTGSYNWTMESEEEDYDRLLVLPDPELALAYRQEFDRLRPSAPLVDSA